MTIRHTGFALALLAAALPCAAQAPAPPPADAELLALLGLFDRFCLDEFPDDALLAAGAASFGWTPLDPARLRNFLHDDPGRGWQHQEVSGNYVLTLELPPFHSCTVRKVFAGMPDVAGVLASRFAAWGAQHRPEERMTAEPVQQMPTAKPLAQTVHLFTMRAPDGRAIEQLGAFVATYANSPVVEIRLVRMRGNNPR